MIIFAVYFTGELSLYGPSGYSSHLCCCDLTYNPGLVCVTAEIKHMRGNLRLPALSEHFLSKRWADWLTSSGP